MSDLEGIKRNLNIESFDKLTNEQMTEILKLHGKGKVSIAQLEQIAMMAPHFAAVAQEAAKALAQIASTAASSQKDALAEVGKTRDAIVSLASHPSVEESTLKLIIEKLSDLAKQIERMNNSNNSFFGRIKDGLAIAGGVLLILVTIGAAAESRGKA